MTPLLLGLAAYAAVFAAFGPRFIRAGASRLRAAPRLGLVLWTALPTSWIVAVLAVGLAATAHLSGGLGLAGLLHACLRAVRAILTVHHPADVPAAVALLGSLALLLRLGWTTARQVHHNRGRRTKHRREVRALMRTAQRCGQRFSIIDSTTLVAYCVPGRRSEIVLTTGVLRGLPRDQICAVVAHEQAHLRGRHHLYVTWGSILATAFPFVPLLRRAPHELARLVEWAADDQASARHGTHSVARALATMATGLPAPTGAAPRAALSATGSDVLDRVRRLVEPQPANPGSRWLTRTAITAPVLVLAAATAVLLPAATADPTPLCQGGQPPPQSSAQAGTAH